MRTLESVIPPELSGRPAGLAARRLLGLSATQLKRAKFQPNGLLLDGARVFADHPVCPGQVLTVNLPELEDSDILPVKGPLDIVYEDDDLLVLNKAPGITVHPGHGHWDDTLGNYLAWYFKSRGLPFVLRVVNRLDKGTSGLMCAAKNAHAHELLKNQLHTPQFRRIYLAVCQGDLSPASGLIDLPIGRCPDSIIKHQVCPEGAPARTRYQVLGREDNRTLVRLELDTGRTHQIRVHLSHLGHPLLGDFLYGTEEGAPISRPALHSTELFLRQPVTGQTLHFHIPLPADMAALVPKVSL